MSIIQQLNELKTSPVCASELNQHTACIFNHIEKRKEPPVRVLAHPVAPWPRHPPPTPLRLPRVGLPHTRWRFESFFAPRTGSAVSEAAVRESSSSPLLVLSPPCVLRFWAVDGFVDALYYHLITCPGPSRLQSEVKPHNGYSLDTMDNTHRDGC